MSWEEGARRGAFGNIEKAKFPGAVCSTVRRRREDCIAGPCQKDGQDLKFFVVMELVSIRLEVSSRITEASVL